MSDWLQNCKTAAGIMVCGFQINPRTGKAEPRTGHWSPNWLEHGLVRKAEVEGWGRELRAYAVSKVCLRIMEKTIWPNHGVMPAYEDVVRNVDDFLPKDTGWIRNESEQAARYRDAQEQRDPIDPEFTERLVREFKKNPENARALLNIALTKRDRKIPRHKLRDVSKPAFEDMQQDSPNKGIHMTRVGYSEHLRRAIRGELTETSRRMTGEHDE